MSGATAKFIPKQHCFLKSWTQPSISVWNVGFRLSSSRRLLFPSTLRNILIPTQQQDGEWRRCAQFSTCGSRTLHRRHVEVLSCAANGQDTVYRSTQWTQALDESIRTVVCLWSRAALIYSFLLCELNSYRPFLVFQQCTVAHFCTLSFFSVQLLPRKGLQL